MGFESKFLWRPGKPKTSFQQPVSDQFSKTEILFAKKICINIPSYYLVYYELTQLNKEPDFNQLNPVHLNAI